jgi:hypothetical protein
MHLITMPHSKLLPVIMKREREMNGSLNLQKQWSRSDIEIGEEAPSHYQLMRSKSSTDSKEIFRFNLIFVINIIIIIIPQCCKELLP